MTDRDTLRERIERKIALNKFTTAAEAILADLETTHVLVPKATLADAVVLPRDLVEFLQDNALSSLEYDGSVVARSERALQFGHTEEDIYQQDAVEVLREMAGARVHAPVKPISGSPGSV